MSRSGPIPVPRKRRLLGVSLALAILGAAGAAAALYLLPGYASSVVDRELARLGERLSGRLESGEVRLDGLSEVVIDRVAWTDGTDWQVEVRDVRVEVEPMAVVFGGRRVRSVEAGRVEVRLGDPARPFARVEDALERARGVVRALGAPRAHGEGTAPAGGASALNVDLAVASLAGVVHLAGVPIVIEGGYAALGPSADVLEPGARAVSATVRGFGPGVPETVAELSATFGAGAHLREASALLSAPVSVATRWGTVAVRGLSLGDHEAKATDPSWVDAGRGSVAARGVTVRWDDLPPAPEHAPERWLPAAAPEALRALLATRTLREIEVDAPALTVFLASRAGPPAAAAPSPEARADPPDTADEPREDVFRHRTERAWADLKARAERLQTAGFEAAGRIPPVRLAVHGATVRTDGPASLSNLDVVLARDGATGRIEGRLAFECPEAGETTNEVRLALDPAARSLSLALKAAHVPLAPYRPLLPPWVSVDAGSALKGTDLSLEVAGSRLVARGFFRLSSLTVTARSIATVPLRGLDLAGSGTLTADLGAGEVSLEGGRLSVGAVQVPLDLRAEGLADGPRFAIRAGIERIAGQDLLASIPRDAIPALEGVRLGGTFAAKLDLEFDTRDLAALKLDVAPDAADLVVVDLGRGVQLDLLQKQFVHRIEQADGTVIQRVVGPDLPEWVPLDEVPKHLVDALTTGEDAQFHSHKGFSLAGIRRSLQTDLARGGFVQGASTLSQQLVKNLFLSREKTLARKLQEVFITWQLERTLSKDRILELYLNVIEWGPEVWGLRQAAMHYFGKRPSELDVLESAFLVSIIPNPRLFHKYFEEGALSEKFADRVKGLVRELGRRRLVPADQVEAALSRRLRFEPYDGAPATRGDEDVPLDEFGDE